MNSVTMHGDLFHGEIMPKLLIVALVVLGTTACTTQPLQEAELEAREYRRAIDRENWELCKLAYEQNGRPTWHKDHIEREHHRHWTVKSDLSVNNCRMILGDYWAEY